MPNIINRFAFYFYSLIILLYAVFSAFNSSYLLAVQSIFLFILLWFVTFRYYFFLDRNSLLFMTNLFIFGAGFLGFILGFYIKIWFFDLIIHFYAGMILIHYALAFIWELKKQIHISNYYLLAFFLFIFSVSILVFWELIEYIFDIFLNTNHTHYKESGIHDTMMDLIVGIIGSILSIKILKKEIVDNTRSIS